MKPVVIASIIAATLVGCGYRIHSALMTKALAQDHETSTIENWNQSYTALDAYEKTWRAKLASTDQVFDLAGLISRTSLEPFKWPDLERMAVAEVSGDELLFAHRICVSDGSNGIEVEARTAGEALRGLQDIAARPDLTFDGVRMTADKERVAIRFDRFCILLRGGDHV